MDLIKMTFVCVNWWGFDDNYFFVCISLDKRYICRWILYLKYFFVLNLNEKYIYGLISYEKYVYGLNEIYVYEYEDIR